MQSQFRFLPQVVLRTPALSFETPITIANLQQLLNSPSFMEALYLASPQFYEKSKAWADGSLDPKEHKKVLFSIINYLNRMRSRCTPFGLFAGCSVVEWNEEEESVFIRNSYGKKHTRLDMHYLCNLAQELASSPLLSNKLRFFSNSTHYHIGNEVRYVEYEYQNGERIHLLNSVESTPLLQDILKHCKEGLTKEQLVQVLTKQDIQQEEAMDYIDQVINAQLLVSELEPSLTGEEYIQQLIAILERINEPVDHSVAAVLKKLKAIDCQLSALDDTPICSPDLYEEVAAVIKDWGLDIERNKLFQTDLIHTLQTANLSKSLQTTLLELMPVLGFLSPAGVNKRLQEFKQKFYERYEEAEVPLLAVMDTDTGICYSEIGKNGAASLIDDLLLPEVSFGPTPDHSKGEQFLFEKIRLAESKGQKCIHLEEFKDEISYSEQDGFPPSLAVLFRLVDKKTIHVEGMMGPSAVNLLGRFAHADTEIGELVREITQHEQEVNSEVLFAEIVHMPEKRVSNILMRPVVRKYEIPYLAKSCLPEDQQLPLQDIFLSVKKDRLVIRSERLNKEIMPRLGTAHNYTHNSLPVYHFLCDMQNQGIKSGFNVQWSPAHYQTQVLPRLMYKNAVLGLASWELKKAAFEELIKCKNEALEEAFKKFQTKWALPDLFVYAEGDRTLLVDANNMLTVNSWINTIKTKESILLKEFLFEPTSAPVHDLEGKSYVNQFIAPLINCKKTYTSSFQAGDIHKKKQTERKFSLGSEWLYYKLYCGEQSADKILIELIFPLVQSLKQQGLIDYWFFIRYYDPNGHLRFRLHLPDIEKIGSVIGIVYLALQPFKDSGYLWKIQTCTYQRELERYGRDAIELSERLFHCDSIIVIQQLLAHPKLRQ